MRKPLHLTKLPLLLSLTVVGICCYLLFGHAHAQNLAITVNLDWDDGVSSCTGTANGQAQSYYNAIAGDTASLHIVNASSTYSISVDVTESGQATYSTTLAPGNSADKAFPVNSEITVSGNGTVCTSGHGGPGDFYVEAATGSVTCSIQNNQVWTVTSNYSGIAGTATLYRGSTYVEQFAGIKNSTLNEPVQFAAQSSAATYYLYYGSNNSAPLLGQATCPAVTASASKTTTPTPVSPPPATTTPKATPKSISGDTTPSSTKAVGSTDSKKPGTRNTSLTVSLSLVGFVILASAAAFGYLKFFKKPSKFIRPSHR